MTTPKTLPPLEFRTRGNCKSGKFSYSSETTAIDWIDKINKLGCRTKRMTKCYQCRYCGMWHLTSQKDRG